MLGEPHPAAADAVGERFTFEKYVTCTSGVKGYADVWLRDHFAWEYKGKHKNLAAAYKQLNDYREDLLNPPLLVVCDMNCFEVHTNFGKTKKRVYKFDLRDLELNQVTRTAPFRRSKFSTRSSTTPTDCVQSAPTPLSPKRPPKSLLAWPNAWKSKSAP